MEQESRGEDDRDEVGVGFHQSDPILGWAMETLTLNKTRIRENFISQIASTLDLSVADKTELTQAMKA